MAIGLGSLAIGSGDGQATVGQGFGFPVTGVKNSKRGLFDPLFFGFFTVPTHWFFDLLLP